MNERIRSLDRLKALPEVFTLATVCGLFGMAPGMASTYIGRWKEAGLVSSLGERTGVHFNLLTAPNAPEDHRNDAIAYLLPGARVVGASALHAAGWTTQIPRSLEIAVPYRRSLPSIPDLQISTRPKMWFASVGRHILRDGPIPVLSPAEALADAWKTASWRPDVDELEWDEIDRKALHAAFRAQGLEVPKDWEDDEPLFPIF